jgi:predicted transport protein
MEKTKEENYTSFKRACANGRYKQIVKLLKFVDINYMQDYIKYDRQMSFLDITIEGCHLGWKNLSLNNFESHKKVISILLNNGCKVTNHTLGYLENSIINTVFPEYVESIIILYKLRGN